MDEVQSGTHYQLQDSVKGFNLSIIYTVGFNMKRGACSVVILKNVERKTFFFLFKNKLLCHLFLKERKCSRFS